MIVSRIEVSFITGQTDSLAEHGGEQPGMVSHRLGLGPYPTTQHSPNILVPGCVAGLQTRRERGMDFCPIRAHFASGSIGLPPRSAKGGCDDHAKRPLKVVTADRRRVSIISELHRAQIDGEFPRAFARKSIGQ